MHGPAAGGRALFFFVLSVASRAENFRGLHGESTRAPAYPVRCTRTNCFKFVLQCIFGGRLPSAEVGRRPPFFFYIGALIANQKNKKQLSISAVNCVCQSFIGTFQRLFGGVLDGRQRSIRGISVSRTLEIIARGPGANFSSVEVRDTSTVWCKELFPAREQQFT